MRHVRPCAAPRDRAPPPEERSLTAVVAQYIGSFPRADAVLDPPLPEVAFVGRSNVGKSSLLNAVVGQRIAKISGTPGKTSAFNVFRIGASHYFLDLPGYGYARAGKVQRATFRGLVKHALRRERLRGVVWLLDIRHPPSADDRVMQDVLTCMPGHDSGRVRHIAPRRSGRAPGDRHDRDSGAPARRAGNPTARAGHVSLPHRAREESSHRYRRCCRPRIHAESDAGDGDVSRCGTAGAVQSGGVVHHEPRPAVSPHRDRAALTHVELIPTRRAAAGGRDLPLRARHQLRRTADRQLPGPVQRRLEPRSAPARSGTSARQGARAGGSETRFWRPVAHRTPPESAQITCIPCATTRARSHPSASSAAAQAFAVRPSPASTVTERAAPRGALRCDAVRTDPPCRSTTASVRRVLSGSGMPTARCVARAGGPTQRYWPPRSSSALSTTLASANAARSSAYPGAMLSTTSAIPVRRRISRRTVSSAGIDTRRWSSESM